MNIKWIPSHNKNNKYIEILLKALDISGDDSFKRGEKNILHIHWYAPKKIFYYIFLKFYYNAKIVWTLHNNFAHDYKYPRIDKIVRAILLFFTDAVIIQQKSAAVRHKNVFYIPHVHYVGAYGPRREKVATPFINLLSLGAIAPYKRNEKLIEAVKDLPVRLLIIGKGKPEYVDSLGTHPNVEIKNTFVPDHEISKYLSQTDYSIFYYDDSELTSGGLVLSLSYNVPVIVRNLPCAEIVTEKVGFVYETDEELRHILEHLEKPDERDTIHSVIENSPEYIATRLKHVYDSTFPLPHTTPLTIEKAG